jgi:cell division control protein 6
MASLTLDPRLIVLDEIDHLVTGSWTLISDLYSLASPSDSRLTLIGIANALDLTQRASLLQTNTPPATPTKRKRSSDSNVELGDSIQLLHFAPYGPKEMAAIIGQRLGFLSHLIKPAALELACRKVAAATGDLRTALQVVRRTLQVVEDEQTPREPQTPSPSPSPVKRRPRTPRMSLGSSSDSVGDRCERPAEPKHVIKALKSTRFGAGDELSSTVSSLILHERLVLVSIVIAIRRASSSTTVSPTFELGLSTLQSVYEEMLGRSGEFKPVSGSEFVDLVVGGLESKSLVRIERKRLTPSKRRKGRDEEETSVRPVETSVLKLEKALAAGGEEIDSICKRMFEAERRRAIRAQKYEWEPLPGGDGDETGTLGERRRRGRDDGDE